MKHGASIPKLARSGAAGRWVMGGACLLAGSCSLQDLSKLRDESLFGPDAGLDGADTTLDNGGVSGAGGSAGASAGNGGTSSEAGAGGAAGAATAGSSGTGTSGTGGAAGSAGAGTGGVGGTGNTGGAGDVGGTAGFVGNEPDAGPDTNVVVDPGFETGISGWTILGNPLLSWESQGPLAGGHCLHTSSRDAAYAGPSYPLTNLVQAGATYGVSAWVRTTSPSQPIKITVKYACTGDSGDSYLQVVPVATAQNYWQQFQGQFVVPTCELQHIDIYVENPPKEQDIFLDEFRVELIAPP